MLNGLYVAHPGFPGLDKAHSDLDRRLDETAERLKEYKNSRAHADGKRPANEQVRTSWTADKEAAAIRLYDAVGALSKAINCCNEQLDYLMQSIIDARAERGYRDPVQARFALASAHAMWLGAQTLVQEAKRLVEVCNEECPSQHQRFDALAQLFQSAVDARYGPRRLS